MKEKTPKEKAEHYRNAAEAASRAADELRIAAAHLAVVEEYAKAADAANLRHNAFQIASGASGAAEGIQERLDDNALRKPK